MSIISLITLSIGLSMDAFAISIAKGMTMSKKELFRYAWLLAIFFGGFQALMPLIGWWIGSYFQDLIKSIDHWIAFGLLFIIGLNMIREAWNHEDDNSVSSLNLQTVTVLAVATSIDALAVGVSFAFLSISILQAITIIGIITFVLSFAAVYIGNKVGGMLEKYAGLFGGLILIGIGLKILFEHLTA